MSLMKTKATGRCDTSQGGSETVTVSRLVCRTTTPDGHCHDVLLFATDDIDAHPPCGIYILTQTVYFATTGSLHQHCGLKFTAEFWYSISESAGVSRFVKLTPHCIFLPTVTTIPMDSSCPSLAPRDGIYRGIKGWACLGVLVWHSHWPEIDLKAWVRLVL